MMEKSRKGGSKRERQRVRKGESRAKERDRDAEEEGNRRYLMGLRRDSESKVEASQVGSEERG